jgi:hypothetical protein
LATELRNPIISTTDSIYGVREVISNHRVNTGHVSTACSGHIPFEGTLERDFLILADFNSRICQITPQPLKIAYSFEPDTVNRYTPDFLVRFRPVGDEPAWSPILYEVKYEEELRDRWKDLHLRFRAATALCRERGWRFRIITDKFIRTPMLKNITFLRGYRIWPDNDGLGMVLLNTIKELQISTPSELLASSFWSKDTRMAAIGILWNLIVTRAIGVDLTEPLTMESEIWSVEY